MKIAARLAALAAVAVATIGLFGIGTPGGTAVPRPFSAERWKAAKIGSYERCAMVSDLRYRIGLNGKTARDVVALLGEDVDKSTEPPRVYALCPSFADVYILEIAWRNGRVASTRVRDT